MNNYFPLKKKYMHVLIWYSVRKEQMDGRCQTFFQYNPLMHKGGCMLILEKPAKKKREKSKETFEVFECTKAGWPKVWAQNTLMSN